MELRARLLRASSDLSTPCFRFSAPGTIFATYLGNGIPATTTNRGKAVAKEGFNASGGPSWQANFRPLFTIRDSQSSSLSETGHDFEDSLNTLNRRNE